MKLQGVSQLALTLLAATCAATLLSGCAGYNHVLFMTKSNAGLDIDASPPTAEINISRKEVVVAPNFEGGQTPPVAASFGSQLGNAKGAPGRFFFGADQTFSGGDAALTLAQCYNLETGDCSAADATLTLGTEPDNANPGNPLQNFVKGLQKPGQVKPFIFGTDTQFGLKVAWNGAGGVYPETLKLGYNRKEFALAPVTVSNKATNQSVTVKIPSFLATVNADAEAGMTKQDGGGVAGTQNAKWMQYFATGKAATSLATHLEVREAMLKRMDPAQGSAFSPEAIEKATVTIGARGDMANIIVAKVTDPQGVVVVDRLANAAKGVIGGDERAWAEARKGYTTDGLRKELTGRYALSLEALLRNAITLP